MYSACEKLGNFKENRNYKKTVTSNQKETFENFGTNKEEIRLGESNNHRA